MLTRRCCLAAAAALSGVPSRALPAPGTPPFPSFTTEELDADTYRRLHASLRPPVEKWMEIPWETDLAAARERAARERKPLLMWVMDGHPLGCT